jgi:hypothetical protein
VTAPAPRLPALRVAGALIALEALAALAFAVLELSQTRASRPGIGIGVGLLMLGYTVLLAVVARGVARGRRWSRGLAAATQLLLLLLGWSFRQPPTTYAGFAMAATALAVLVCLLLPSSTRVFIGEPGSSSDRSD